MKCLFRNYMYINSTSLPSSNSNDEHLGMMFMTTLLVEYLWFSKEQSAEIVALASIHYSHGQSNPPLTPFRNYVATRDKNGQLTPDCVTHP